MNLRQRKHFDDSILNLVFLEYIWHNVE